MKRHEMLLTAALLDWAHAEFINHTCGDLPKEIKELLTDEQWVELSREYHEFNRDLEYFDPKSPTAELYDDAAMWVMSKKIRKEAESLTELFNAFKEGFELGRSSFLVINLRGFFNEWQLRAGPLENRDCDSCDNDGECFVTMLQCKGYKKRQLRADV